ncbi:MAG TPA: hypothetical protein V6D14_01015 [Coleofasciculaceae cyanobacterium]
MSSGNEDRKNSLAGMISSILRLPAASILTSIQYLDAALIAILSGEAII